MLKKLDRMIFRKKAGEEEGQLPSNFFGYLRRSLELLTSIRKTFSRSSRTIGSMRSARKKKYKKTKNK